MKNISGYIFKGLFLITLIQPLNGQDTLRTFGPRVGIDLSRIAFLFTDPAEISAELSVDVEIYKNIYPVVELGYSTTSTSSEQYHYSAGGMYGRFGADYNHFPVTGQSKHHSITTGFRYGIALFTQQAEDIIIEGGYWDDYMLDSYESSPTGHWIELVGGLKTEVVPNFFLGWSVRYKILMNPEMDPLVTPQMIPGYGRGTTDRAFGFSYSILYKIPLLIR